MLAPDDRDAAIAWADSLGSDVERAVREAATARRLGALADVLDQRLVWPRFRNRFDPLVPERAAARAELEARGPEHPSSVRLRELPEAARSSQARRALAARPTHESPTEREERIIRESLADDEELLRNPDDPAFASLWGAIGGRALRVLSDEGRQRLFERSAPLRERLRSRRSGIAP